MKNNKTLKILGIALLIFFSSSLMFAQRQTGSLRGVVTDDGGTFLPGVEVSIKSPSLMGTKSFVTRADGTFRFPSIPPGRYLVTVKMPGFQTIKRPDILVNVGITVTLDFEMKQAAEAIEIVVTATTPTVDTKSSKLSVNYTTDLIESLPVGRDIFEVIKTAPGVIGGVSSMVSVHGSALVQSRYVLDGVDITDPLRGYRATWMTFDAVEEVEMILGGLSAENAKSSAGFINVVTKSGGNTFTGGITATYTGEDFFKSSFSKEGLEALGLGLPTINNYEYDISAVFGGPIIKDRLWFFLNPRYYAREKVGTFVPFTAGSGEYFEAFPNKREQYLGFGKLTFQLSNNLKYIGMLHYYTGRSDRYDWWNNPRRAWTWGQEFKYTPWTLSNVLSYVIDQNTVTDLKVGYINVNQQNYDFYKTGVRPLEMRAHDRYYNTTWGLIPWNEDYERKKLDIDWNLTRFLDGFLGANHEVKIGAGYTWWKTRTSYFGSANYYEYWYKDTPWFWHNTTPYKGQIRIINLNEQRDSTGPQLAESNRTGFFFQDMISFGEKITLNVGVRYDRSAVSRPEEVRLGWFDEWGNGLANILAPDIFLQEDLVAPEIKNAMVWAKLQPRIGLIYDPFGDGKTAVKAHWARMMDDIVGDMTAGLHPFDPFKNDLFAYWYDNNHNGSVDLPPIDGYVLRRRPAQYITDPNELAKALDPDMTAPFVDEFTIGINRELFKDCSLDLTYIYRENKNIAETVDTNNPLDSPNWLPYSVTDPGPDAELGTEDDAPITVYGLKADAPWGQRLRTNVDMISRKYQGLEVSVKKRMSNGWQFLGNVVYSKTYGNMGGSYGSWRGDLGGFMNPNQLVNLWGRTNFDRPLTIKLMGTVILPLDFVLSGYFNHADGAPGARTLTVYLPDTINGVSNRDATAAVRAAALGEFRGPSIDMMDLRLEKVFNLSLGRLGIYVDAFNVFGYKSLAIDKNNGGYIYQDGSFEVFPTYGNINSASGVRSYRFTVRYSF